MHSPDALTTTGADGKRIGVFPASPPKNGFWEVRRRWVQWGMIGLYVAIPWMRINGHPILLLDIVHRRFSIFGTLFFAHEAPYLVFIALTFLLGIALFTTLFGRVWCGWSCPQTVFIDRIFRKIESMIEGDHLAQRRLANSPMNSNKIFKRSFKFLVFAAISILLGQVFLGYFVGPKEAFHYLLENPSEHPGAFLSVLIMSGIVFFDFGWFREQFCLVACPYGRFQSVMMDQGSLFLAYDEKRGDCINCNKCVSVCPTGIDVRHGLQFECIACTACADACDSVMMKIKKPKKLIGYGSLVSLAGKKTKLLRGRTVVYGVLLVGSMGALVDKMATREVRQIEVIRAVDTPYQQIKDENGKDWVLNHFKIRFYNLDWNSGAASFQLDTESRLRGLELIRSAQDSGSISVGSGENQGAQFFIKIPRNEFKEGVGRGGLEVFWSGSEAIQKKEVNFVGPWN